MGIQIFQGKSDFDAVSDIRNRIESRDTTLPFPLSRPVDSRRVCNRQLPVARVLDE